MQPVFLLFQQILFQARTFLQFSVVFCKRAWYNETH